jgi:hypothetical protein
VAVTDVSTFERFFRAAADLDVDKADLRRFDEFVDGKIGDLLGRRSIWPSARRPSPVCRSSPAA